MNVRILKQCPTCRGGDECSKCLCGCHVPQPDEWSCGGTSQPASALEIISKDRDVWKNRALEAESEANSLKQKLINVRNVACRAAGG